MKELIDKFMAGQTTADEERHLFAAFADDRQVAPEYADLRPMMQWYASLSARQPAKRRPALPRFAAWTGAAATVAMLLTIGIHYFNQRAALPDEWREYAGSYVIKNGVKYTNLAQIMPDIKRAEQTVSRNRDLAEKSVNQALERPAMPDVIDMSDPEVSKIINKVLSDE